MSLPARPFLQGPHLRLVMPLRCDVIRARTGGGSIVEITLYEACPPGEPQARWHAGLERWLVGREYPDPAADREGARWPL